MVVGINPQSGCLSKNLCQMRVADQFYLMRRLPPWRIALPMLERLHRIVLKILIERAAVKDVDQLSARQMPSTGMPRFSASFNSRMSN